MSSWIATNPSQDRQNLSYQVPMPDDHFENLVRRIVHVSVLKLRVDSVENNIKFFYDLLKRKQMMLNVD